MSAVKCGLVAVLAIGGALLSGSQAKAQDYYYPNPPTVVVPAPVVVPVPTVVYTSAAYYAGPTYYAGPVFVRPRPLVGAVVRPVRAAFYTARPYVYYP